MLLFSHWVLSDSLRPHGLHHARLLCSPLSPGVCSNSCPLSRWCYLTIASPAITFSFFSLQSFRVSRSFPVSWRFISGGQSIGASATVLPVNSQGWSPLGLTVLVSLQSRDPQESSPTLQFENISSLVFSFLYGPSSQVHTWLLDKS